MTNGKSYERPVILKINPTDSDVWTALELNRHCEEAEPGYNVGAWHLVSCAQRSSFCLRDHVRPRWSQGP
jgi:hypothetical protein